MERPDTELRFKPREDVNEERDLFSQCRTGQGGDTVIPG